MNRLVVLFIQMLLGGALGAVLASAGIRYNTWQFWAVFSLAIAMSYANALYWNE